MLKPKLDEREKPRPKHGNPNKDRFRRSKKHESRIATALGGKRLPRSGGLAWSKHDSTTAGGDVQTAIEVVEHKRTEKKSMAVQLEWLHKVAAAAKRSLKDPAVVLTFEDGLKQPEDWVLIPLDVYTRLTRTD